MFSSKQGKNPEKSCNSVIFIDQNTDCFRKISKGNIIPNEILFGIKTIHCIVIHVIHFFIGIRGDLINLICYIIHMQRALITWTNQQFYSNFIIMEKFSLFNEKKTFLKFVSIKEHFFMVQIWFFFRCSKKYFFHALFFLILFQESATL